MSTKSATEIGVSVAKHFLDNWHEYGTTFYPQGAGTLAGMAESLARLHAEKAFVGRRYRLGDEDAAGKAAREAVEEALRDVI